MHPFGNAIGNSIVGHIKLEQDLSEYMRKQGLDPHDKSARDVLKRYQKTVTNPNATDEQYDAAESAYEDLMWSSGANGSPLQARFSWL